jgi:uncharacterized membrane protein
MHLAWQYQAHQHLMRDQACGANRRSTIAFRLAGVLSNSDEASLLTLLPMNLLYLVFLALSNFVFINKPD